jgi:hypothetical protein
MSLDKTIENTFKIEEFEDFYRISGVFCENNYLTFDFSKNLLPERSQEQHADHARDSKNEKFTAQSAPVYHSLFEIVYKNREGEYKETIERFRKFLEESFENDLLLTLTKIFYNQKGKDIVVHNVGQEEELIEEYIADIDELLEDMSQKNKPLEAIFKNNKTKEINDIYKWITGVDTELRRMKIPKEREERSVSLGRDLYVFVIDANFFGIKINNVKYDKKHAFGVKLYEKKV